MADKYKLVFEAQESASQKVEKLRRELANLGGPQLVKTTREISKLEREIDLLNKGGEKGSILFSRFTQGIAVGNIIANAASAAWRGLVGSIGGIIQAAVDSEKAWNDVSAALERHNQSMYGNLERVQQFAVAMQTLTGLSDELVGKAFQRLIDANFSTADAFDATRAAADLAAAKGMDFEMAAELIAKSIDSKTNALSRYGISIDKTLPREEQMAALMADLNERFGGAAAARMDTYAGKVALLGERWGDFKEQIGGAVMPVLTEVVDALSEFVKELSSVAAETDVFSDGVDKGAGSVSGLSRVLQSAKADAHGWAQVVVGGARLVGNAFQVAWSAIETALSPVASLLSAVALAISGEFSAAGEVMKNIFSDTAVEAEETNAQINDLMDSFVQFSQGVGAVSTPSANPVSNAAADAKATIEDLTATARALIPQAVEDVGGPIEETVKIATIGMADMSFVAKNRIASLVQASGAMLNNGIDGMISALVTGRDSFKSVFVGMAQDFMQFFIKQALAYVLNMFIPGLGGILGGIFDTPVNDRMAATQGRHFAQWFTRGALAELGGRSELAVGLPGAGSNRIAPVMGGGGNGGSSMMVMNVTVSGNVMSDAYVEKDLAPRLQRMAVDGRTLLNVRKDNKTGGRDVRLR